ncbi:MAG: beta-ketoacyl-[acyl-carrier-protein] synthase II [Acidobacteria bacterium]|nr:MAG: beta-ketoacyl-[acyl-carrier-protein] synthase II [Acidobacteriota bacterium]
MADNRRVVITGVGMVSPLGTGTEPTWSGLLAGQSGVANITLFDASRHSTHFAAEVKGFDPRNWMEKKDVKKMDRFIQFAVAAADFAVADSGLKIEPAEADMIGVYIGSGIGGFATIEREHETLMKEGPRRISPFFIPAAIVNLASGWVSIRTGAKGPNSATCTACTTSAHAVGDSFRLIQRGDADAMIAGGSEAAITPLGVGGFCAMRALSTRNDDPAHASRPFDKERDGFVIGEGSGIVILEELEHARRRGAPIYCEVVGYGMSSDAYHISAPCENGDGAMRVMNRTLKDAGVPPSVVDYVNVHGTSTPQGDRVEVLALKRVFGDHARRMAISSTKSMTGHLLGAAGGLEAGITALVLKTQMLPPTINYQHPDPECDLDIVPNVARKADVGYALSNSFGFGGTNGALLFRRYEG